MSYQTPLRTPRQQDEPLMRRRAWWIILLNFLVPGLPQVVAGNRRLGRLGLTVWLLGIAGVVWLLIASHGDISGVVSWLTSTWVLTAVQAVLVAWCALWVVLTIDAFRLARIGRVRPRARVALSLLTVAGLVAGSFVTVQAVSYVNSAKGVLDQLFADQGSLDPVDGRYNFVLLGADSGEGREGMRPDSITVVSVDAETGAAVMIGIPRDLHPVRFPADSPLNGVYPSSWKANGAYTYATQIKTDLYSDIDDSTGFTQGMQAMKDVASGVTGLQIPYYVLIDMNGFAAMVDALGGVDIDVQEHLDFVDGSDTNHVYHGSVEAGMQHMDGETALWYARSRKTTSDWDRMRRQRQVQEALLKQFSPQTLLTKFQDIASASPEFVNTDIPRSGVGVLTRLAGLSREQEIGTLELTPPQFAESNLDWDSVDSAVADLLASSAASTSTN